VDRQYIVSIPKGVYDMTLLHLFTSIVSDAFVRVNIVVA